MKKKNIVSVLLAGTLLGGFAVTFTGCIDNDEPEGIKVLREAKAGLLNAKTVLASADAEYQKALAQQALAQAELAQAQAEIQKIQAESAAEVAKINAEAAAALTQAQADEAKARAAAVEAESAAKIAQIQAETQATLDQAAEQLKALQYATQQAEISYKKDLLDLEGDKADYLEGFYKSYIAAQEQYQDAYDTYIEAQKSYLLALADADYNGEASSLATRYKFEKSLKQAVADAENTLAKDTAALAKYTEALAEADNLTPSALQAKYADYKAEYESLESSLSQSKIDREEYRRENIAEYDKQGQLKDEYNKLTSDNEEKNLVVPAFKITIPEELVNFAPSTVLNNREDNEVVVFSEEVTSNKRYAYYVDENKDASSNYNSALTRLTNLRSEFAGYVLDDNDVAWSEANINEWKSDIKVLEESFAKDSTLWAEAKAVYNSGIEPKIAEFTVSGYTEYTEALEAYNATVAAAKEEQLHIDTLQAKVNDLTAAVADALQEYNDLQVAYNNTTWTTAYDIYNEAIQKASDEQTEADAKAQEKHDATVNAAWVKAKNTTQDLDKKIKEAEDNLDVLLAKLKAAIDLYNFDATDLDAKAESISAQSSYDLAETELQKLRNSYDDDYNKAWNAYSKAFATADHDLAIEKADNLAAYYKASEAASNALIEAQINDTTDAEEKAATAELEAAKEKWENSNKDLTAAQKDLTDAQDAQNDSKSATGVWKAAFTDLQDAVSDFNGNVLNKLDDSAITNVDEDGYPAEVSVDALSISLADAKALLKSRSILPYGNGSFGDSNANANSDTFYGVPVEQIVALTESDIIALVKTYIAEVKDYQIPTYYQFFGEFGQILAKQAKIAVTEAVIKNPSSVQNILDEIDEQIAALKQQKKDREDEIDAAYLALYEQNEVIEALEKDFTDKITAIEKEKNIVSNLKQFVEDALASVATPNTGKDTADLEKDIWSEATIAAYQENLQKAIDELADTTIPAHESALDDRQAELAAYQAGRLAVDEVAKSLMENEEAKLAVAQEMVDYRKAALDSAIAYIESLGE